MDRSLKILIAVSNRLVLDLAKGALSYLGFSNVRHSNNAPTEALLSDGGDILIIDYGSLKGEGASLLRAVRTRQELSGVKTVLLAPDEIEVSELKHLYRSGVNSVIQYPFQMNDLLKALEDVVRSVPSQVTDTFDKIRQLDFFSFLDDGEMLKLLKMTKCRKYQKGDIIFEEGERGERFYVLIEGNVSILKVLGDHKEELLANLKKGACFGEMAVLENTTRSATARADGDALLFELDSRLMDGYDDIITLKLFKKLVYIFSDRLRNADLKIEQLARLSPPKAGKTAPAREAGDPDVTADTARIPT